MTELMGKRSKCGIDVLLAEEEGSGGLHDFYSSTRQTRAPGVDDRQQTRLDVLDAVQPRHRRGGLGGDDRPNGRRHIRCRAGG